MFMFEEKNSLVVFINFSKIDFVDIGTEKNMIVNKILKRVYISTEIVEYKLNSV